MRANNTFFTHLIFTIWSEKLVSDLLSLDWSKFKGAAHNIPVLSLTSFYIKQGLKSKIFILSQALSRTSHIHISFSSRFLIVMFRISLWVCHGMWNGEVECCWLGLTSKCNVFNWLNKHFLTWSLLYPTFVTKTYYVGIEWYVCISLDCSHEWQMKHYDLRNRIVLSDNHHLIILFQLMGGWCLNMDATSGDILWR